MLKQVDKSSRICYHYYRAETTVMRCACDPRMGVSVMSMKDMKEEYLNDMTYILDMRHVANQPWHQYDVLLAVGGYGWDYMIAQEDYIASADLSDISQVTTSVAMGDDEDITASFHRNGGKLSAMPEVRAEGSSLSVAGVSKVLKAPLKIVLFNQTRVLRFFTVVDDELLVRKYAESFIRRNFGTKDEMKLGTPVPEQG